MVDALESWHTALAIEPEFWMARGNRGRGLLRYGQSLYDDDLVAIFFFYAHKDLTQAIEDAAKHPESGYAEARKYFEDQKAWIEDHLNVAGFGANFEPDNGLLGQSHAERSYRQWCLANRLFLNPVNDVISRTVAAHDNLSLPDFQTKLSEPPVLIGFFNQLKQEYVTARWDYYCGVHADRAHFSDRYVSLSNTLDYSSYGLAIEQVRTAFRVGYSLFDKIAFFLNSYFDLQIPLREVSFGRVWRDKSGRNSVVARRFDRSKNLPLRGLYWLSKDLFDDTLQEVMSPDARALSETRNHLEHRYLKVHEIFSGTAGMQQPVSGDLFVDTMAYSLSRRDFEDKTLRVLKLARAALIHLSLAMHREEQRRARARRSKKPIIGQSLDLIEYRWKR